MKALIISPQPFFTPRGTPFSVYYRTLVTSELGVQIDLLTYGVGSDVDIPGVRIIRIPHFSFLGHIKVGPSPQKLFLDIFMVLWTIGLLLRNRYDFVHAHEEAVFFCNLLKPIFRFKLVYDMHSSLPQQLTNFKFTTSRFLIGVFKRLEDWCLRTADAIITICPDLYCYVNGLIRDHKRHLLIENSLFDQIVFRDRESDIGEDSCVISTDKGPFSFWVPSEKRFITYAGTLEPYQGIDILIEAFKAVVAEAPDAFLLVVGGREDQVERYRGMAERLGIESSVLFTGYVSPGRARCYNRIASVLVSPRNAGTNTPLKIYEQLASGIPLVATDIHSHTQVLDKDVAVLVQPEAGDMARGILLALSNKREVRRITRNARRLYETKYSRPAYKDKVKRLLEVIA